MTLNCKMHAGFVSWQNCTSHGWVKAGKIKSNREKKQTTILLLCWNIKESCVQWLYVQLFNCDSILDASQCNCWWCSWVSNDTKKNKKNKTKKWNVGVCWWCSTIVTSFSVCWLFVPQTHLVPHLRQNGASHPRIAICSDASSAICQLVPPNNLLDATWKLVKVNLNFYRAM